MDSKAISALVLATSILIGVLIYGYSQMGKISLEFDVSLSPGEFDPHAFEKVVAASIPKTKAAADPTNATYILEDKEVPFTNGEYESSPITPDSVIREMAWIVSTTTGDINFDGVDDAAVVIAFNGGGSGVFFYLAAAIHSADGYHGTNALFVGDRIRPTSLTIQNKQIDLVYTTRRPWEAMVEDSSITKTRSAIYIAPGELTNFSSPELDEPMAATIAADRWGRCLDGSCTSMSVERLDGVDGVWYVRALYEGVTDDSVAAVAHYAQAFLYSGQWTLGPELRTEWSCHEGRGHQELTTEVCK